MTVRDYNLALVQLTIDEFRVTGFGSDAAMSLVPLSDLFQDDISADGANIASSRLNDNRHELTITVRRNTSAFRQLWDRMQQQLTEAESGPVGDMALQIYDPNSGDKVSERQARFKRSPDLPFERTASEAAFVISLPNPTIKGAPDVPITI